MGSFWIGFLAGFFANWVFGMVTRLLPANWSRFSVRLGNPFQEKQLGGRHWLAPVRIAPTWARAFMQPLQEYLVVEVSMDDRWVRSKWDKGDVSETLLRADAAMTINVIVLSAFGDTQQSWFLGDRAGEHDYALGSTNNPLKIRIVRNLDGKIADEVEILVSVDSFNNWVLGEAKRRL